MQKARTARITLVAITVAASMSLSGVPASAAPTTPNGYVGACNMVQSWPGGGAAVPPGGGMELAMNRDATQGNAGMLTAVAVSTGSPFTC
jgi:hypothetical protein